LSAQIVNSDTSVESKMILVNNKNDQIKVSLSITAGPLYKVTQTVQLSGNEINLKQEGLEFAAKS